MFCRIIYGVPITKSLAGVLNGYSPEQVQEFGFIITSPEGQEYRGFLGVPILSTTVGDGDPLCVSDYGNGESVGTKQIQKLCYLVENMPEHIKPWLPKLGVWVIPEN